MTDLFAFAVGLPRYATSGDMLDCTFPLPLRPDAEQAAAIRARFDTGVSLVKPAQVAAWLAGTPESLQRCLEPLLARDRPLTAVRLDRDGPIEHTAEAYLKLQLLSHRLALPNSLNLEGIFAQLPNVVWTSAGPVAPAEFTARQLAARAAGENLEVFAVDKFPKMTNYVVPEGVRIADASRIRLGAYLGSGTTVMHEGFINFNAGALGPNMVEGRISQGVILGAHSDLGGGASTMGTLSGGGDLRISLGEHCLIGANAGTGIPLGDRCTIEAGLYLTAGTPVLLRDGDGNEVRTVKARELAGGDDLLFLRNAANGRVECRSNRNAVELNDMLHAHN